MQQAMDKADAAEEKPLFEKAKARSGRAHSRAGRATGIAWIREYAHKVRPDRKPGDRVDFTETLFWTAATKTDAKSGVAKLSFDLSDSVTSFRIMADGFSSDGAIGSGTLKVESVEPFYVEPKIPLQVTAGDQVLLPVALVNSTDRKLVSGKLRVTAADGIKVSGARNGYALAKDGRIRQLVTLDVGDAVGKTDLVVAASVGDFSDKVTRKLDVQPLGFPRVVGEGGMLSANSSQSFDLLLPQEIAAGSLETEIAVHPTPLANLTEALQGLMREPHGCFEQTSSTNYPLVMAQQYFMSHTGVDSALIEQSQQLLKKGYDRLIGFECKEKGYEWFGQDPGHEALSAYGLMEFTDMSKVMQVDKAMLTNTRKWLLSARDGKGGFNNKRRALHTWLVEPDLHSGYITWALLESGERGIKREVLAFKEAAQKSNNSYVTALGANVAAIAKDQALAKKLMKKLAAKQTKEGWVDGAEMSIVGSRGQALQIETTALATLAWLRDKSFAGNVQRSINWLAESAKGGRYGSTQSTVLALRAIVEYDKSRAKPKKGGALQLLVDGKPVGKAIPFSPDTKGAIAMPSIAKLLKPGKRKIALQMKGGAEMPFAVTVRYNTLTPESSPETRVFLRTVLKNREITEGQVTEVDVTMSNIVDEAVPTPVAIIGIPGGLEVRHDQLKELKKAGRIAAYEVIGRDLVLYWRELKAKQVVELPISLVAAVPGSYAGPASRAYEYYGDEFKHWVAGLKVKIKPRR